jgi:hypothetical protein
MQTASDVPRLFIIVKFFARTDTIFCPNRYKEAANFATLLDKNIYPDFLSIDARCKLQFGTS